MTTATPQSAALKGLTYAEEKLEVNSVYQNAIKHRDALDTVMTALAETRDQKRIIERQTADREMEILFEERSKHPEMSAAGMDKHLKLAHHADELLRDLRNQHVKAVNDLDGLEIDKSMLEVDIKIATARMIELGGYLQYLAVLKQSV